jgi:sialate O-acetylesterase
MLSAVHQAIRRTISLSKRPMLSGVLLLLGFALTVGSTYPAFGQAEPGKGTVTHPYPAGAKGDLWLVGGQSNMAGYGTLKKKIATDPRILFYASNDEWMVAQDPFENLFYPSGDPHGMVPDYTHLPVGGAGPLHIFAEDILQATGHPIGIIGVDTGKPMTMNWDPTLMDHGPMPPPPYLYGPMIKRVLDVGGYGRLKGMFWYQGESDAIQYPSASKVYEKNLLTFIDRVRKDTGNPDLPIILVQLARVDFGHLPGEAGTAGDETYSDLYGTVTQAWDHVRDIQRRVAQERPHVYVVPAVDLYPMVDPIHIEYEASQRLGKRAAEVALSEVYKVPGHGTPIRLESITVEPLQAFETGQTIPGRALVRVRFSGVTGKLHAAGRPSGFSLQFPERTGSGGVPSIYTTEFDPKDPAVVLLRMTGDPKTLKETSKPVLYYGAGLDPYCNIVDDKDMAVPAFGPIAISALGEKVPGTQ